MQKTAVRRSVSALEHATVLTLSLSLYLSLFLFPCRSAFAYGVLQALPRPNWMWVLIKSDAATGRLQIGSLPR